jgi:hypothetical protein
VMSSVSVHLLHAKKQSNTSTPKSWLTRSQLSCFNPCSILKSIPVWSQMRASDERPWISRKKHFYQTDKVFKSEFTSLRVQFNNVVTFITQFENPKAIPSRRLAARNRGSRARIVDGESDQLHLIQ